jgi:6-phosphogluconate dehydrogenase
MTDNGVADAGLIGLAVMGENSALNIADRRTKRHGQVDQRQCARMGILANAIAEAVFARCLLKDERVEASRRLPGAEREPHEGGREELINAIRTSSTARRSAPTPRVFQLMREAQKEYNWKLNFDEIAAIWRRSTTT